MIPVSLLILGLLSQLISNSSQAQYFTGPTAASMGGAGVAAADASETVFLNPASLAHSPDFEFGAFYKEGMLLDGINTQDFGLTLVDNSSGILVPGALSYFRSKVRDENGNSVSAHFWQASIGFFLMRNLSLGASLFRLNQDPLQGPRVAQWNSTIGVTYVAMKALGFGFAYYNFIKQPERAQTGLDQLPGWRFGFNYGFSDILRFRADYQMQLEQNPGQKGQFLYGAEVKSFRFLSLRFGHRIDDVNKASFITSGLGFDGPRLKMNYSFEKNTQGNFGAMHSVDLRIPVW